MARKAKTPAPVQEYDGPIGHNSGMRPLDEVALDLTDEEWEAHFAFLYSEVDRRLDELCAADLRFKDGFPLEPSRDGPPKGFDKWDDEVMARAANLREKFRALGKTIDALHTLEKEPILRAGKMVDGARNSRIFRMGHYDSKKRLIPGADAPLNRIADRCTLYATTVEGIRREEARKLAAAKELEAAVAAEAAAQSDEPDVLDKLADSYAEAEEARKLAEAKPAELTRVHGTGSVMSLRTRWVFVLEESNVMDLVKAVAAGEADVRYLSFNASAIGTAVRSGDLRFLAGCVIREESKV